MRMFSEPESWLGLRSERMVAVEFGRPAELRPAPPRQVAGYAPEFSWRQIHTVMRRTVAVLWGR